jgi:hypothetical protein
VNRGSFTIIPRRGGGYEIVVDDGREIVSRAVDRSWDAVLTAVQIAAFRVLDRATRRRSR